VARLPRDYDLSSRLWTMENLVRRLLIAAAVAAALFAASCTASTSHPAASVAPLPPDPHTADALLKIATAFNHDYDTGDYSPVYERWDARSQAIISRADYIRRHKDCPSGSHALSQTESVSPGPHGAWLVHYEIGGQQLTDYWFYVHAGGCSTWRSATRTPSSCTGCPRASTPRRSDVTTDPPTEQGQAREGAG
jgi:hypothetical protein